MLKITIIQVGKTRQSFLQEGEREFLKRLSNLAKVMVLTVKEFSSLNESKQVIEKEAKEIEKNIVATAGTENAYKIILDPHGKKLDSPAFSKFIEKIQLKNSHLVFIIGGTFGLSDEIKQKADLLLSFSDFTFTHEMIRLLLLEQLYRAFCISKNKSYHY